MPLDRHALDMHMQHADTQNSESLRGPPFQITGGAWSFFSASNIYLKYDKHTIIFLHQALNNFFYLKRHAGLIIFLILYEMQ